MAAGYLSIKNFEEFQHYKDRAPPWIKLYNRLLDDYEFGRLPDASKAHLISLWLLASRMDNKIPNDPPWIASRINATGPVDIALLASTGFVVAHDASEPLAPCKHGARPEREREGETEKKTNMPAVAGGVPEKKLPEKEGTNLFSAADFSLPETVVDPPPPVERYPRAFLDVWEMYRENIGEKNSSKARSYTYWKKLDARDREDLYFGLSEYCVWIKDERKKRVDVRAKHLETFINGRNWEAYLEKAT
jgi:hypothetical protein